MKNALLFIFLVVCLVRAKGQTYFRSATDEELLKLRNFYPYPTSQWDSLRCAWYGDCAQPIQNQLQPESLGSRSNCTLARRSFGWYSPGSNFASSYWNVLTDLSYFNYDINASTGTAINSAQISSWGTDATVVAARNNGVKVNLCLKLFNNSNEFATFFGNTTAQSTVITNAVNAVVAANAQGINVDFEGGGLTGTYGNQFISFLSALKSHLNTAVPNSEVSVDLMGSLATAGTASTFLPQLNSTVDLVIMMGYDYYYDGSPYTGPVAPTYQFNNSGINISSDVNSFLQYINLNKFILAIPFYGRTWPVANSSCNLSMSTTGTGNAFSYSTLAANANHYFDIVNRDLATFNGSSCYLYSGTYKQGFYDDVYSYQKKFNLINERNLAGVAYWRLGFDNGYSDIVNVVDNKLSLCAVVSCSDTIYDMGGPNGNYHNNEDYTFTISPTNANSVTLTFLSFGLESTNDYLKIYNGTSTAAPLLVNLTGTSLPSAITASSGSMTLQFHSNGSTTQSGYMAVYSCSDSGGGQPDLTVVNQTLSNSTVSAGGNLTVYCAENNSGPGAANSNVVSIYLSSDGVLTPGSNGDSYLGFVDIPVSIAANSNTSIYSKNITIPAGTAAGNYYVFFWADGGQIISESLDNNNFASAQLTVSGSVQNYSISTSSNPTTGGTITGSGTYGLYQQATVTAAPNSGYTFINWTENGSHVTSTASYTFNVTASRNLVANFSTCSYSLGSTSLFPTAAGGTGAFWVYTANDCYWTATSTGCNGMITLVNASGSGNGMVTFDISANTNGSPRSCSIVVGGQTFTVNQAGYVSPCGTTPSAPNGLSTGYISCLPHQNYLSWNGSSVNVTTFEVERALASSGPFSLIASTGTTFNYLDTLTVPGLTYYYRVRACCNGNCSGYTNVSSLLAMEYSISPISIVASSDTICLGDSVYLAAQGGYAGTGAVWKWRFNQCNSGTLVDSGHTAIWVHPTVSGNYVVKPEGATCGSVTCAVKYITVRSTPATSTISAGGPIGFCMGGNVSLSGNNNSGIWSNGSTTPTIQVASAGDYFVTNSNVCGVATSNHIQITVSPLPVANAGIDASICAGNSMQIGGAAAIGNTYSWYPSTGLSNTGISNPTANPATQTTYILTAISPSGCSNKDTIVVTVNQNPTIDAGNDRTICNHDTVLIGAVYVSGNTYEWAPSIGLNDYQNSMPVASPDISTSYTVTVTNSYGCIASDDVLVTVNTLPIVNAGVDTLITQGDSIVLGGNPTASGNGPFTFSWWPTSNLNSSSAANPLAFPPNTTAYLLAVEDANGCLNSDTVIITVNQTGCAYSLSQNTLIADSNGTSQSIAVNCGGGCQWNITTGNCNWLSVNPSSGTGNGIFTITIPATIDTVTKNCNLTVQGEVINITQYGRQGSVTCASADTSVQANNCDLAAANISGAIYQWYRNGVAIPNANSQYYTATQTGYYHVSIALGNCTYRSSDHYIACGTGITEVGFLSLSITPNPSFGKFMLSLETEQSKLVEIKIFDLVGRVINEELPVKILGAYKKEIDLGAGAKGIYLMQLKTEAGAIIKRIEVQ